MFVRFFFLVPTIFNIKFFTFLINFTSKYTYTCALRNFNNKRLIQVFKCESHTFDVGRKVNSQEIKNEQRRKVGIREEEGKKRKD